jgi:glycolate oxidase
VLADGTVMQLGGAMEDAPGLDLLPLVVGSEGTLGIITEAVLRLTALPAAYRTMMGVFRGMPEMARAVSAIVAARILPAGMEMIDRATLEVINQSTGGSFPPDAAAVLLAEVDGEPGEIEPQAARMEQLMKEHGALDVTVAHSAAERESLWGARRAGYGALARSSLSLASMDVTVPRDRLVPMISEVIRLAEEHDLKLFLVAHAGDGNMHPAVPFDPHDQAQRGRLAHLMDAVARTAVAMGGSISGEHGIGIEKLAEMSVQYSPESLDLMRSVRRVFDPSLTMNPGKNIPAPAGGW